jgi:type II secretory pathway pseudopilin PulG
MVGKIVVCENCFWKIPPPDRIQLHRIFLAAKGNWKAYRSKAEKVIRDLKAAQAAKGYTLLEVIVVTCVSGFLMTAVLSAFLFLASTQIRQSYETDLQVQTRRALTYFRNDVPAATGLDPSSSPTGSTFAVDVILARNDQTPGATVLGVAVYSYDPVSQTLTVVHRTPIFRALLVNSNWPTQEFGFPDSPLTLMRGVQGLTFTYLDSGSNPGANPVSTKRIEMSFSATLPVNWNPAQTTMPNVTAIETMKNKGYLTDPNDRN